MCVCVREREQERGRERMYVYARKSVYVCMCVRDNDCVKQRWPSEGFRGKERECVCERDCVIV